MQSLLRGRAKGHNQGDVMAERLEADCKALSEEIRAYEGVADQLRAKLAAKERTREIARQFADYCRKLDGAFETVSIPFEKKRRCSPSYALPCSLTRTAR